VWCVCVWRWSGSRAGSGGAGLCQRVMERPQSGRDGLAARWEPRASGAAAAVGSDLNPFLGFLKKDFFSSERL
jgi:hypothetical protein